ncbi:MAG: MASE1 domain-containing protein [Dehalococcoidia bacterium]
MPGLVCFGAIAYLVPANLTIWLNDPDRLGAGFWPAAGVTLAVLLRTPTRLWVWPLLGVAVAEAVGDYAQGYPTPGIPWWTAGNVLDPLLGAALLRRAGSPRGSLLPLGNLLRFIALAVVAAPLAGASVGSIGNVLFLGESWLEVWPKYVAGDALGVLVVAPVVLTWSEPTLRRAFGEWMLIAAALSLTVFAGWRDWPGSLDLILPYLLVPVLTWAALRFGAQGAAWAVFFTGMVTNVMTAFGGSPFARLTTERSEAIAMEQLFLLIMASGTFVLAAIVNELSDREQVQRLLRDLANSMPQLVWIADAQGHVDYYNDRRAEYLGAAPRAPREAWYAAVHPDDAEGTLNAWRGSAATGASFEHEHRLRMTDGTYRWHLSRAERRDGGRFARWYGTSTDIHEMKLTEAVKDEFIAVASHELRNPVGAIHGIAQLLQRSRERSALTADRLTSYTASLLESTSYLARLTDDLMDVSRLQRDGIAMHPEPTDLTALVRSVTDPAQWAAPRVVGEVEGELGTLLVDPARIRQVLVNLIDNALKYSDEPERVLVRARRNAEGVVIEVVDRGIGIPESAVERIFAPFGRAANTGVVPGLGMGLYVAREIAERHGGRLSASGNADAGGTTMRLWLPASLAVSAAAPGAEASPASSSLPARVAERAASALGARPDSPAV